VNEKADLAIIDTMPSAFQSNAPLLAPAANTKMITNIDYHVRLSSIVTKTLFYKRGGGEDIWAENALLLQLVPLCHTKFRILDGCLRRCYMI
jgi:hypothetical protein